jgi:uncharacterized repeat protein (TIGR01451 family)
MALILNKSAVPTDVELGTTINITVVITNDGTNDPEQNVVFTDVLPAGLNFVPGTVTINGTSFPAENPNLGISLPDIGAADIVTVTFDAVANPGATPATLSNTAQATSDPGGLVLSNTEDINVFQIGIVAVKSADRSSVSIGETLTYVISITNTGDIPATNVVFTDKLDSCQSFITDSFRIDGIAQAGEDPNNGVDLPIISPGQTLSVSFDVKIDCIPCPPRFIDSAAITAEFQLGSTGPSEIRTITTNEVITIANLSSFKQISREENVCIPCQKPDAEQILNTMVDIVITDTKVIETIKGISIEGQKLTGFKLIVEGKLNQKVEYVAALPEQPVHAAHFIVPFSSFIILPENFEMGTPIEVEAEVEDVFAELLDSRTIFKNITFRLVAKFNK